MPKYWPPTNFYHWLRSHNWMTGNSLMFENPEWVYPKPFNIDWRSCKPPRRQQLAKALAITHCKSIKANSTLELGTMLALLADLQERVGMPEDSPSIVPVISKSSADFIEGLVMDAKAKGAVLLQEVEYKGGNFTVLFDPLAVAARQV